MTKRIDYGFIREFQEDHVMTEAEAAALSDTASRPVATIPVKPCPPRPWRLHRTINYKVTVKTANDTQDTLRFNVPPTAELIADALWYVKVNVPEPSSDSEVERKRYERSRLRYDNLIALVKLAEITVPETGKSEHVNVMVAGVQVGHVSITAHEAWTA